MRELMKASFRGVPFCVKKIEMQTGRRVVTHEYPQRDKPYVEDLGRATRKFTITAFVIGDDYIEQIEKLLSAIEEPGSGTFVHPQLGEMRATLTAENKVTFSVTERMASVTLVAIESGELEFPSSTTDTVAATQEAADELQESAISQFCDSIDLSSVSEWVDAALNGELLDKLGIISNSDLAKVFDKVDEISSLAKKGISLLSTDPAVFANNLLGALGLSRVATSVRAWTRVGKQLKNLVGQEKLHTGTRQYLKAKKDRTILPEIQKITLKNSFALESFMRQTLIAQAVGVCTVVGTKLDDVDASGEGERPVTTQSYDELVSVRDALLEIVEEELLVTENDRTYESLEKAYSAIYSAITATANQKARIVEVETVEVLPALVHAYDYHEDANRDQEIAIRNAIEHEGFVPTGKKKVLNA